LVGIIDFQAAPLVFGALIGVAVAFIWVAFAPGRRSAEPSADRLDDYVDRVDLIEQEELQKSFVARALLPMLRRLLKVFGRLAPQHGMENTRKLLIRAGEPGGLTALDFYGLRLLTCLMLGGLGFWFASQRLPLTNTVSATLVAAAIGFYFPHMWLRGRAAGRQREIERALPNALDMLTIGVEAGLAFESAMLRVSDHWDNALTRELRRAVLEMRVGASRDEALERLADRADVSDLRSFVIVLMQSTRLGVSIAQVLHNQSVAMRQKRRQRAEELARQAPVKLAIPLVLLIFPALLVVIMGPAIPGILEVMTTALGAGL
jgi:tight adherence protein C